MVKTISTVSNEHINAVQTDLTQLKEKENMLKEINCDESHSRKSQIFVITPFMGYKNSDITMKPSSEEVSPVLRSCARPPPF